MSVESAPPAYASTVITRGYRIDETPAGYSEGISTANVSESDPIKAFLMEIGRDFCSEYYQLFMNQGFDSVELMWTMSEEDLKEIGIQKLGHRRKIMMALQR